MKDYSLPMLFGHGWICSAEWYTLPAGNLMHLQAYLFE
jgi:hypothetical protein